MGTWALASCSFLPDPEALSLTPSSSGDSQVPLLLLGPRLGHGQTESPGACEGQRAGEKGEVAVRRSQEQTVHSALHSPPRLFRI